jgi:coiled-coil domain-containing protein 115
LQGFFDLARANHSGTKRYGQDYYDYRMQAQRIVNINTDIAAKASAANGISNGHVDTDPPAVKLSVKSRLSYFNGESDIIKLKDPLTWFGLLTPQPLRSAQAAFAQTVEHSIPRVLNATSQLRQMEIEIGRLRKYIRKLEKSAET